MNYYAAREIIAEGKGTGLYHYTIQNDNHVYPVGYCSSFRTCAKCRGQAMMGAPCGACEKGVIRVDPCPGHATREEAREHYRQYELDGAQYDGRNEDRQERCVLCHAWTQRYATFGRMRHFWLCEAHCNREALDVLTKDDGDAISSV